MRRLLEFGRLSLAVICCGLAATASAQGPEPGRPVRGNPVRRWAGQFSLETVAERSLHAAAFLRSSARSFRAMSSRPPSPRRSSPRPAITLESATACSCSARFRRLPGMPGTSIGGPRSVITAHWRAGFRLPSGGTLSITQTATYSPAYLYELFPTAAPLALGEAAPVIPAYRTDSSVYRTSAAAAFGSPRGTQVTTTADYSFTNFHQQAAGALDFGTYGVGAKLSRALSRRGGVSAGYNYQTGDFTLGGVTKEHRVTMGVDYSPALSRTRRATLRLDLSPSVVESPAASGSIERQSHFQGEAAVGYPFRPKWKRGAQLSPRGGLRGRAHRANVDERHEDRGDRHYCSPL